MKVPFRGVTERTGVLLRGPAGWGEFSPFPGYEPPVTVQWLRAAREASTEPWPQPLRSSVPVNVTVPAVAAEQAHALVTSSGCSTAKVKVAQGDDEGRVEAVRAALGPAGKIRIDVNGSWDLDTAARRIHSLARYDLEYVEQPVETLEDMAALRRRVDVPLAADESLRSGAGPRAVGDSGAADLVVLKVQPLGGVRAALGIAEMVGLPAVVSSALETSVGIAAGVALAAALPELPYACGLGTVALLEADVVSDSLLPVNGSIEVRRPEVDDRALGEVELHGDDAAPHLDRLSSAEAAL
jgi:O-succinylbenzoate synthase